MNQHTRPPYNDVDLYIGGAWTGSVDGRYDQVENPATEEAIGRLAIASKADLEKAAEAAASGFAVWREVSPFERYKIMRRAAEILRSRVEEIAVLMTLEQGKPLVESRQEVSAATDLIDWFAEEGRRVCGLVVPSRLRNVSQLVIRGPIGPVAAFSPWNFPINQSIRKISQALAAGCSIVIKGPEETPASCAQVVRAFHEAGVPAGVINLVFGIPAEVSEYLIAHPAIRKVSFTGSTAVGKHIAAMSGAYMRKVTMELGGHAPAIVFEDADLDTAVSRLAAAKFRNCGQICVSPTRFLIQRGVYDRFLTKFVAAAESIRVGDGLEENTQMGPLASQRRLHAMEQMVEDAVSHGATVKTGGRRLGNKGHFFSPTVLTDVPNTARIMNEEPFGPIAPLRPFDTYEEVIQEANRLPYGLSAFVYTKSSSRIAALSSDIETGMIGINHHALGLPELPFGGIKDSGHGTEGGPWALDDLLVSKVVTHIED